MCFYIIFMCVYILNYLLLGLSNIYIDASSVAAAASFFDSFTRLFSFVFFFSVFVYLSFSFTHF